MSPASPGCVAQGLFHSWYGVRGAGGVMGILRQEADGLEIRALAEQIAAAWAGFLGAR